MSATGEPNGFTLLEMLVVLGIAALISGIGFPAMQRQIAAQEFRTGVASATALLRDARARALRGDGVIRIEAGPEGLRAGQTTLPLPRTVSVALDRPIAFYGDGSATGGIVAITGAARQARIAVATATGLPTVSTP
jgi:prepilin-type N-terminal cleavage/methylation domain-containing protein